MKKTGLKSFSISFIFSLFAIFVVNGSFWRAPKASVEEYQIPSKNIMLFLKKDVESVNAAQIIPLKKISLSVLQKPTESNFGELLPEPLYEASGFDIGAEAEKEAVVLAQAEEVREVERIPVIYEGSVQEKIPGEVKIVKDFEKFVKTPVVADFGPAKIIVEKETEVVESESKIVVAGFDVEAEQTEAEIAEVLSPVSIPLEKDEMPKLASNVEIVNGGGAQEQVALADSAAKNFGILAEPRQIDAVDDGVFKTETATSDWVEMGQKPKHDEGWEVAKGIKFPKNKMALEALVAQEVQKELVVAQDVTPKNLLIPIPEEILREDISEPQIESSRAPSSASGDVSAAEEAPTSGGILSNIGSIFTKTSQNVGAQIQNQVGSIVQKVGSSVEKSSSNTVILPTEIRMSFAPNRAEISGQTVRWLAAFAQKAQEDKIFLEIRIDGTSSQELQQKRLNLLYNILNSKGVNNEKIRTIFTNREPNSFVVRTVKQEPVEEDVYTRKSSYQQW